MLGLPLSIASPAGQRGRLSILIFHRVLPRPDPLQPDLPDAVEFETHMRWVRQWFKVLPLSVAIDRLFDGEIPSRAMAISFDDGYADNEELAAPILKRLGLSATFFVSTGFLGGACMWNDRVIEALRACRSDELDLARTGLGSFPMSSVEARREAIACILKSIKHLEPERRREATEAVVAACGGHETPELMMRPEQVRHLNEMGMELGAHTRTHPILKRLGAAEAREEMGGSKETLEQLLGTHVELFAYPNGVPGQDYDAEHVDMARQCGFRAAVSTAWGAASMRSDRFQLPRFTPWDRTRWRYGARLLANLGRSGPVAA